MTIRRTNREIDLGFGVYDSERYDSKPPRIQILTPKPPLPQDQNVYCANCKARMDWKEKLELHMCSQCGQFVDYKLKDAHITQDENKPMLKSYSRGPYSTGERPFLKNVKIESNTPNYERPIPKERIQHIRIKGSPADALRIEQEEE